MRVAPAHMGMFSLGPLPRLPPAEEEAQFVQPPRPEGGLALATPLRYKLNVLRESKSSVHQEADLGLTVGHLRTLGANPPTEVAPNQ